MYTQMLNGHFSDDLLPKPLCTRRAWFHNAYSTRPSAQSSDCSRSRSAASFPDSCWQPDAECQSCNNAECQRTFSVLVRKHHCRKCGLIFCRSCAPSNRHEPRQCSSCRVSGSECDSDRSQSLHSPDLQTFHLLEMHETISDRIYGGDAADAHDESLAVSAGANSPLITPRGFSRAVELFSAQEGGSSSSRGASQVEPRILTEIQPQHAQLKVTFEGEEIFAETTSAQDFLSTLSQKWSFCSSDFTARY